MPKGNKLDLIILKGHLLIEEIISRIIEIFVPHSSLLRQANLRFYQKLFIARSMCWEKHNNEIWKMIKDLNMLRNKLSHSLEPEKFEENLNNLLNLCHNSISEFPGTKNIKKMKKADQLRFLIVYCIGFLDSFEKDVKAFKITTDKHYRFLKSLNFDLNKKFDIFSKKVREFLRKNPLL